MSSSCFYLKLICHWCDRLQMRQHFTYPCRLLFFFFLFFKIWSHVRGAYLFSTKAAGTPEHGRSVFLCVSPDSCCWVASLYDEGWGQGWGEVHTCSMPTHAHTGAHTHAHTHTATKFNILPLQILSINKQLEKNDKSKLCLWTHWMRWLVVLLSKHRRILSSMLPVIIWLLHIHTHH